MCVSVARRTFNEQTLSKCLPGVASLVFTCEVKMWNDDFLLQG